MGQLILIVKIKIRVKKYKNAINVKYNSVLYVFHKNISDLVKIQNKFNLSRIL